MSVTHIQLLSVPVADQDRAKWIGGEDVQDAPGGRFVTFEDPDGNGLILQATAAHA